MAAGLNPEPAETAARLADRGVSMVLKTGRNEACLSIPGTVSPVRARETLYAALNRLEPRFTVFISGVPYCFMPDAWDHILYRRKAGSVYAAVPACAECRLKGFCPGIEKESPFHRDLREELSPVLAAPREIVLELTRDCAQNCRACFSGKEKGGRPLGELMAVLRQAKKAGVKNIRFTGGEPFLSPHLLPLLRAARDMGFYTLLNTSAAFPGRRKLREAAGLVDNVLVSMQGRNAATDRFATGADGAFLKKAGNIRFLRASGVDMLRLGTVISRDLLENFSAYYALAAEHGARIWELYRPMLSASALAGAPEFNISLADMRSLSRRVAALPASAPRVLLANPAPLCAFPAGERKNFLGAVFDDGHTRLVYDPRGFFKPSYCIEKNLGTNLAGAWRSPFLKKLSGLERPPAVCRSCRLFLRCLGGSRFLARRRKRNRAAEDPWRVKKRRSAVQ